VAFGDGSRHGVSEQASLVDRRVGHHRNASLLAPRQEVGLHTATGQAVDDLVAGYGVTERQISQLCHVGDFEVADAPVAYLALIDQAVEGVDGLLERGGAPPVQEVEIEAIGAQSTQAGLAGSDRVLAGRIRWVDLADEEDLVPPSLDGFPNELLSGAISIQLGGVDEGHAEVDAEPQGGDLVRAASPPLGHAPRPQTEHGDALARRESGCTDLGFGHASPFHRDAAAPWRAGLP
jgi:hypothetical protein